MDDSIGMEKGKCLSYVLGEVHLDVIGNVSR